MAHCPFVPAQRKVERTCVAGCQHPPLPKSTGGAAVLHGSRLAVDPHSIAAAATQPFVGEAAPFLFESNPVVCGHGGLGPRFRDRLCNWRLLRSLCRPRIDDVSLVVADAYEQNPPPKKKNGPPGRFKVTSTRLTQADSSARREDKVLFHPQLNPTSTKSSSRATCG